MNANCMIAQRYQNRALVGYYGEIYIGDVSPNKLAKTRMAKSVHEAGWSMLRNMLSYKSIATGGVMRVVPERFAKHARSVGAFPPESVGCTLSEAAEM